jgi:hypothetical protein
MYTLEINFFGMKTKTTTLILPLVLGLAWAGCSKHTSSDQVLNPAPNGILSRYDLLKNDYDPQPVTTFVLSYNSASQVTDIYEKAGQNLIFYTAAYSGSNLGRTTDNNLGTQNYSYDASGRISEIDYTTPVDTGKRVFTYDGNGRLISVFDSVTNPPSFPSLSQYVYTYDNGGNNVVQVTRNTLDLSRQPTLNQETFYTFDSQPNAFTGWPPLMDMTQLPGSLPALYNKNNVTGIYQVGTIPAVTSGSSVPVLDTIGTYKSTRTYQYNAKGFPISCQESFQDLQYNYSGNRSFTYEY